jgi:endonuclease/exonuclease/phosphatase family metal-dependent hydrolase
MDYLNPDVVTFNEIPDASTWQMTNFVQAFLPGYYLATNSTSDGYIRSVIVSRYPITRSQSWIGRANLAQFGYNGPFTRDLFEAEIQLPEQPHPWHVFTTHLKAATDSTSLLRRAAEASAISNFFVTVFLPANGSHPYSLSGDLNEDIYRPPGGSRQPIQILTSAPTGLKLSTPVNAISGEDYTLSIQGNLNVRFDYILASQSLWTNVISSQVFRTDLLPNPPPPLLASDDLTSSDHLPVIMEFNNPYATPALEPRVAGNLGFASGNFGFDLKGRAGRTVIVDASTNLTLWLPVWTNILGTGTVYFSDSESSMSASRFYRLREQ